MSRKIMYISHLPLGLWMGIAPQMVIDNLANVYLT